MSKNEIKKKNISANALSDDDLEDVAGGTIYTGGDSYRLELIAPDGTTYEKSFGSGYKAARAALEAEEELLKHGYTHPK